MSSFGITVYARRSPVNPAGLVNRAPGESRVGLLSGDKKGQFQEQLQRFLLEGQRNQMIKCGFQAAFQEE